MDLVVENRWFKLIELALVALGGIIWYLRPEWAAWPLLIVLLPWILRLLAGGIPFQRTALDLAMAIFLATMLIGLWASYDPAAAQAKFWILFAALLAYYAFAGQPAENLWLAAGLLSLIGLLIACSFLLEYDWREGPIDLGVINRVGAWWVGVRPSITTPEFHPNRAGGLLAMLYPFPAALGLKAWRDRRNEQNSSKASFAVSTLFIALILGIMGIALVMTSSRGAWLALLAALGLWFLWALSGYLTRSMTYPVISQPRLVLFALALIIVGAPLIFLLVSYPGGVVNLANALPGLPTGASRLALAQNTTQLIGDFPYTGGGLAAFSGLYSHYIMDMPVFLFSYSHNFYLDVLLEQGVPGFAAFGLIFLASAWLLARMALVGQKDAWLKLLVGACITSLVTLSLHGLIDDALYGTLGTPLLFVVPGMAVALDKSVQPEANMRFAPGAEGESAERPAPSNRKARLAGLILAVVAGLGLLLGWRKPLTASWYANLGAVYMARVDLADFPSGQWDEGDNLPALGSTIGYFKKALSLDPHNQTAQYRLGLIALLQSDIPEALTQLEGAYQADPAHRGVRKKLGYAYVWAGDFVRAKMLLAVIPEAIHEMPIYVGWWGNQGRADLAAQAQKMSAIMRQVEN